MAPILKKHLPICLLLLAFAARAQAPFARKISSSQGFIKAHQLRETSAGQLLLAAELPGADPGSRSAGVIRFNAGGGLVQGRRMVHPANQFVSVFDARELPDGNLLLLVFIDNGGATVNGSCFLQKYTPDFQLLWSVAVSPTAGYSESRRIQMQPAPGGAFYVYWEGGQLSSTPYANILSKISASGQVLWSQGTDTPLKQMTVAANGDILLASFADLNAQFNDVSIARLTPDGQVLQAVQLPGGDFQYGLDAFPGGDVLVNWQRPDGHYFARLGSAFNVVAAWKLPLLYGNLEYDQVAVLSDSLLYVFASAQAFGQQGSVALRMSGLGAVQKAVYLSQYQEGGFGSVAPVASGGNSFVRPMVHNFFSNDVVLLRMDTALNLVTCPQPPFICEQSVPVQITQQPGSLVFHANQLPNVQKTVNWEVFTPTVLPFCYLYLPPAASFSLPDTICAGTEIRPDTLRNNNAGSFTWTLAHQGMEDYLFAQQPVFNFADLGPWTVSQKITYLHCQTDSFARQITVLPRPEVALPPDTSLCRADSLLLLATVQNALSWQWDNGLTTLARTVTASGTYVLRAGAGACTASDTMVVNLNGANAAFDAEDSLCLGDPLILQALETDPDVVHLWQVQPPPAATLPAEPEFNWLPPVATRYRIIHYTDKNGCRDTAQALLLVSPQPQVLLPPDGNLCVDSVVLVQPDTAAVAAWAWSDGFSALARTINLPGDYTLQVFNGICRAQDAIQITRSGCTERLCFLPNVFAPESAGDNAVYRLSCSSAVQSVEVLEIYDRWGSLVYRTEDNTPWDGQVRGRAGAPGVYVCKAVLRLFDGGTRVVYQDVALLR
jgi:hypothetical protein